MWTARAAPRPDEQPVMNQVSGLEVGAIILTCERGGSSNSKKYLPDSRSKGIWRTSFKNRKVKNIYIVSRSLHGVCEFNTLSLWSHDNTEHQPLNIFGRRT